jgi:uncharacterized protein (DUF302 family)
VPTSSNIWFPKELILVVAVAALVLLPTLETTAVAADGLITVQSNFGPKETMDRLEAAVKAKGFTVFAHIDHAAAGVAAGLPLRPTDLLIFGNPKGGTRLMQSVQTSGIDLPLKALIWEDEKGTTWLSYNDPEWIARRHGTAQDVNVVVHDIAGALVAIATAATSLQK